ncbi:galactokinase [Maribacter sp. 2307ULW6-5]|uniref:galactokinase n=1 Tax=Maribacter sp. 2307ULW6-5 TaxID=3386275 RepID=UPI0039BD0FCA
MSSKNQRSPKDVFFEGFKPTLHIASPGRINIIGEHVDYNMGLVLPAAIDKKMEFSFQKNGSGQRCEVYSDTLGAVMAFDLDKVSRSSVGWENYILGVVHEIQKRVPGLGAFKCAIKSGIPAGSGVSSSAALECGLAFGLNELFDLGLSRMDIVALGRDAEHHYVGTQCGIMDQYASVMGKEGQVLLLDCETVEHAYVPFKTDPFELLMLNTNVSHNLADGQYNVRRQQCEEGVAILRKTHPGVSSLRHATMDMLHQCAADMSEVVLQRCTFVVAENARVLRAVEHLKNNDLPALGRLLYQTHAGLRDQYGVSCPELDFLVHHAQGKDHILGARMVGGGFGGCTLQLIHKDRTADYVAEVSAAYHKAFGIALGSFVTLPSDGTRVVNGA